MFGEFTANIKCLHSQRYSPLCERSIMHYHWVASFNSVHPQRSSREKCPALRWQRCEDLWLWPNERLLQVWNRVPEEVIGMWHIIMTVLGQLNLQFNTWVNRDPMAIYIYTSVHMFVFPPSIISSWELNPVGLTTWTMYLRFVISVLFVGVFCHLGSDWTQTNVYCFH